MALLGVNDVMALETQVLVRFLDLEWWFIEKSKAKD
jgi:hypothetical protein